jgi:hypothetical protein
MGRLVNAALIVAAIGIAYECGREKGARDMFFKWTEAVLTVKANEEKEIEKDE